MHSAWPLLFLVLLALSDVASARMEASTDRGTTVTACEHGRDHATGTCVCARFWSGAHCSEATGVRFVWLYWVTETLGWCYFTAWCFAFFPQCILNCRRASVVGYSFDYLAYNITGFLFYTAFSAATYGLETARGVAPDAHSVRPQDLAFGGFAITMSVITIVQCCVYERAGQGFGRVHTTVVGMMWGLIGLFITLCLYGVMPWASPPSAPAQWSLLFYMGYTKTVITLIKGVPQAYLNYQRKSTAGRAILSILLDLTGGVCALANSVLIAWNLSDWGIITGNAPKVALSLITIFFALFFVFQHYVLYPQREDWDVDAQKNLYRPLGLDDDGPLLHAAEQISGA